MSTDTKQVVTEEKPVEEKPVEEKPVEEKPDQYSKLQTAQKAIAPSLN